MGKLLYLLVVLGLLSSARCYNADLVGALSGLPVVGPIVSPPAPTPAYVNAIGTPAPVKLPDVDPAKWFATEASADPYDPAKWTQVQQFLASADTAAGWAEVCKKMSAAAGSDRSAKPEPGALACSADPSVTRLQQLAVRLFEGQAAVALWLKGAPGASVGAIQGIQGEIRLICSIDTASRQGADSPITQACAKGMDAAYLTANDGKTTFTAFADAYKLVATEIAKQDPKVAQEPAYFGATATKTP